MRSSIVGIRREDKSIWERRVVLTPEAVAQLVREEGLEVIVQPSPRRVFPDAAYASAGARISEDLSPCDIVFAVKEIPAELFQPDRAYVFFSHTIKGQSHNLPMLQTLIDRRCSLIDYERVVDDQNRRLIFFGWYAGVAGMVDTLCMLNERLRALGHESPFRGIQPTHTYADMAELESAIREIGERIHKKGIPGWLSPFVTTFLGYGHVSRGAQHIYDLLPTVEISPNELEDLEQDRDRPKDRLFKVVFHESDLVEPRDPSRRFELQEYYAHPDRYHSIFERHIAKTSLIINGVYWTEAYPRFVTKSSLRKLFSAREKPKLLGIGDISCDIDGSIECTVKSTQPDEPCFVYDPLSDQVKDGVEGAGVPVMAVDNLPCELPAEASRTFSNVLTPFVPAMARANYLGPYQELSLPEPARRALILQNGRFTPPFEYMRRFVARP